MGQTKTIPLHVGTRYTHSIQRFTAREMSELPTGLHGHGPDFPNRVGVMRLPTHINCGTPSLNLFPPYSIFRQRVGKKTNKFSDIFMGLSLHNYEHLECLAMLSMHSQLWLTKIASIFLLLNHKYIFQVMKCKYFYINNNKIY